jgi:hypothetical protein
MMPEQPAIETGKDLLFLLTGPWVNEEGAHRLCADCCTLEGALQINPHWAEAISLVRVDYPRPRPEIIALLDENNQNAPTLILAEGTQAHQPVETVNGKRIMTDPEAICRQLAAVYGGAAPA